MLHLLESDLLDFHRKQHSSLTHTVKGCKDEFEAMVLEGKTKCLMDGNT